jgi:drug/metabolite transporter (DMT)-like permease
LENIGSFAALATALLWSGTAFAFTEVSKKWGTFQLNIDRTIVASFYLSIALIILYSFGKLETNISSIQFIFLGISGLIGLLVGDTFLFRAFALIGPRMSQLIMAFAPSISATVSYYFLGESLEISAILAIITTLFGILIAILGKLREEGRTNLSYKGVLYAFIGAAGQALGFIFAKKANNYGFINPAMASIIRLSIAGIFIFPIALYFKQYVNPIKNIKSDFKTAKLLFMGSFTGPFLGVSLSFIALQNSKVGIASTLLATTPIMTMLLSMIIYKSKLSFLSITGTLIAFLGVYLLFNN